MAPLWRLALALGLLALCSAMPSKLWGAGMHFVDCWGFFRSRQVISRLGNISWSACCAPGAGGPEGNPGCWQRRVRSGYKIAGVQPSLVAKMRREARFERLTYDACCDAAMAKDGREVTMEIVGRRFVRSHRRDLAATPARRQICELAENRTRLARGTLKLVRGLVASLGTRPARVWGAEEAGLEIPVLGFPVAFDRRGLALRLLMSIDFPVRRLLLIATGPAPHLPRLLARARELRPDLEVHVARSNLGCAGGWNEVVHLAPHARWWLVGSYDVAFPAGMLARIAERTEAALQREADGGRPAPGLRTFSIRGQPKHVNSLPAFVLTRRAVAAAGLFDENFWPAYAEDWDYLRRMRLVGGSRVGAATVQDQGIEIVHGPLDWKDGVHYSGIEQIIEGRDASGAAEGEGGIAADEQLLQAEVSRQVAQADNYQIGFCRKYGPIGRAGNCTDVQYADVGPFGLLPAAPWSEWVLDPVLRWCIQRAHPAEICFYDTGLLQASPASGPSPCGAGPSRRRI